MPTVQDMANLDTDTTHSSIPSRDQRGRVYDRPTGTSIGTNNNMAMIIGLILAAIAVVILLALLF